MRIRLQAREFAGLSGDPGRGLNVNCTGIWERPSRHQLTVRLKKEFAVVRKELCRAALCGTVAAAFGQLEHRVGSVEAEIHEGLVGAAFTARGNRSSRRRSDGSPRGDTSSAGTIAGMSFMFVLVESSGDRRVRAGRGWAAVHGASRCSQQRRVDDRRRAGSPVTVHSRATLLPGRCIARR